MILRLFRKLFGPRGPGDSLETLVRGGPNAWNNCFEKQVCTGWIQEGFTVEPRKVIRTQFFGEMIRVSVRKSSGYSAKIRVTARKSELQPGGTPRIWIKSLQTGVWIRFWCGQLCGDFFCANGTLFNFCQVLHPVGLRDVKLGLGRWAVHE